MGEGAVEVVETGLATAVVRQVICRGTVQVVEVGEVEDTEEDVEEAEVAEVHVTPVGKVVTSLEIVLQRVARMNQPTQNQKAKALKNIGFMPVISLGTPTMILFEQHSKHMVQSLIAS